ncbi:MAG: ribosome biogenesis GTPase Der [Actinobacteria bacterium]|jgi:GTPase|nr:ribosome biogenesis GTPase Der [Actinomycetota bacterium]NBP54185.1 ribosome biogenesis GTPase Der [Actinomycetota bacterium]
MKPHVVIVGRPNVGKSTLFNRFVGGQVAIVEDRPGITRDRKTHDANWLGREFLVTDTGGWMPGGSELDEKVSRQVEQAVKSADLVLFVVDASVGATDEDERIAGWLRRTGRSVMVVANKADNDRRETDRWSFLSLGLGEPYPVSALHGRRAGDLLDVVVDELGIVAEDEIDNADDVEPVPAIDADLEGVPRVAIVGRPNVGKSTLFNRLCGEERSVVHDMAGTTRDAIDTLIETEDGRIVLVDTAGMRRRAKIDDSAEYYSLVRALRAVDEADVALLVIDSTQGVTSQDQRLAERIDAAGSPLIVILNKWDLLDTEAREAMTTEMARKLYFIGDAPVLRVSALSGMGVHRLLPILTDSIEQYQRRVPTRDVNRVLAEAQQKQPAAAGARVLYALQGAADPPTFTLFVNRELPPSYLRYLERSIREAFKFGSTPIKLRVRRRAE